MTMIKAHGLARVWQGTQMVVIALTLTGCGISKQFQDTGITAADEANNAVPDALIVEQADQSPLGEQLVALPAPTQKMSVALYDFQDLTGRVKQHDKPLDYYRNFTQTNMDIVSKTLEDAGNGQWFTVSKGGVAEPQNPSIASLKRKLAKWKSQEKNGFIIEGGMVAQDYSVVNGGSEAALLGISGSRPYQRYLVTVYLRAIDAQTHKIVSSVTRTRTLYYNYINTHAYRYALVDPPLKAESGTSFKNPVRLVTFRAIETAVYSLIMEGAMNNTWAFKEPESGHLATTQYAWRRGGGQFAGGATSAPVLPLDPAMAAEAAGQLSPAAGPMTGIGHEYDPGATQIRDMENKHAIRENPYEHLGLQRSIPSDY